MNHGWRYGERRLWIPDNEIGVLPHLNSSFSMIQTQEPCRATTHPFCQIWQGASSFPRCRPDYGEPELQGSNAAPGLLKIAFLQPLQRRQ